MKITRMLFVLMFVLAATPLFALRTADNLQTAYNGESNAHARYTAFAVKADEEGYGGVASLFRAAARAEEIHATNHAAVIRSMGITPVMKIDEVVVRSTAENLAEAIKGEKYEYETMYKNFIDTARAENQHDAVRTFMLARNAEGEHARLYENDATNLDSLKGSESKPYNVCTTCGYTTRIDFSRCPGCGSPREKFIQVS